MMGSVLAGTDEGPGEKIIQQGRQYVEEVNKITGREVVHLVDHYDPELLKNPDRLIVSEFDGHPGQDGIPAMADAFIRLVTLGPSWRWRAGPRRHAVQSAVDVSQGVAPAHDAPGTARLLHAD